MRVHNFGAGPCALPTEVLEEVRGELLDFAGTGMSVVELSHRSPHYEQVHRQALELARTVSAAPEDVDILFIQGGAIPPVRHDPPQPARAGGESRVRRHRLVGEGGVLLTLAGSGMPTRGGMGPRRVTGGCRQQER